MGWSALAVAVVMVATWLVSLPLRNASIIDPVWPIGFVVVGWVAGLTGRGDALRVTVLVAAVTVWGLRLGVHLFTRNRGHGEDFRYVEMREKHGDRFWLISLFTVFATQGVLMWVVSLPLQLGSGIDGRATGWAVLLVAGIAVWLLGFVFESVGDAQLTRFKADPASKGQVMDKGLWRYTRHPNYFGDACVWWGLWLAGISGWLGLATVLSPVAMTYFLVYGTGARPTEKLMAGRPGFAEYCSRTSFFVPRPPKVREGRPK